MRSFNMSTRINPYDLAKIADVGDVPIDNLFNLDEAIKEIESSSVGAQGVIPLSAGGDHSITYPILKGLKKISPSL